MAKLVRQCRKLVRNNGLLSRGQNCCCGYEIPCCSNLCYFPVDPYYELIPPMGRAQYGGPSQITGLTITYTYLDAPYTGKVQVLEQDRISIHTVEEKQCWDRIGYFPGCYVRRISSLCQWIVHIDTTRDDLFPDAVNHTPINIFVSYNDGIGWLAAFQNQGGTFGQYPVLPHAEPGSGVSPNAYPIEPNLCSGAISASTVKTQDGVRQKIDITYNAIGGKHWPDGFTCPGLSSTNSRLRYRGRNALDSDLPNGFL